VSGSEIRCFVSTLAANIRIFIVFFLEVSCFFYQFYLIITRQKCRPSKHSTIPAEDAEAEAQAATQKLSGSPLQNSPHTLVMLSKAVDTAGFSVLTL